MELLEISGSRVYHLFFGVTDNQNHWKAVLDICIHDASIVFIADSHIRQQNKNYLKNEMFVRQWVYEFDVYIDRMSSDYVNAVNIVERYSSQVSVHIYQLPITRTEVGIHYESDLAREEPKFLPFMIVLTHLGGICCYEALYFSNTSAHEKV
eukprot:gene1703-4827_t